MTGSLEKGQGPYVGSGGGDAWDGPFGIKDVKDCRKRRSATDGPAFPSFKGGEREKAGLTADGALAIAANSSGDEERA